MVDEVLFERDGNGFSCSKFGWTFRDSPSAANLLVRVIKALVVVKKAILASHEAAVPVRRVAGHGAAAWTLGLFVLLLGVSYFSGGDVCAKAENKVDEHGSSTTSTTTAHETGKATEQQSGQCWSVEPWHGSLAGTTSVERAGRHSSLAIPSRA